MAETWAGKTCPRDANAKQAWKNKFRKTWKPDFFVRLRLCQSTGKQFNSSGRADMANIRDQDVREEMSVFELMLQVVLWFILRKIALDLPGREKKF